MVVGSIEDTKSTGICDCGATDGVELLIVRDSITDNYLYSDNLCKVCQEALKEDGYGLENC